MSAGIPAAPKLSDADELWRELALRRERADVLEHRFLERASAGALHGDDLALYAEEHDHLVVAIATAARRATALAAGAAADALERHAEDAHAHVELWRAFARASGCAGAGWCYAADPLPATIACAAAWTGPPERTLAEHVAVIAVVEAIQAPVLATLDVATCDRRLGEDAVAALRLAPALDPWTMPALRELLDDALRAGAGDALVRAGEHALVAYGELLDAFEGLAVDAR